MLRELSWSPVTCTKINLDLFLNCFRPPYELRLCLIGAQELNSGQIIYIWARALVSRPPHLLYMYREYTYIVDEEVATRVPVYMGHSPCVYFRLFTLSQGETAIFMILGRSARFAISAFFSIMEHKHHTKVCTETLSLLISIHFTSKFEESQRNWRFYSRHNNAAI